MLFVSTITKAHSWPPSINADHGIRTLFLPSLLSAAPHMAVQANAGSTDSSTDVAFVGTVAVRVVGKECSFPACSLLHRGFGQVLLASLQLSHQGASPTGAVSCKGFPVVRVHL